jgi:hypothetical protein
MNATVMKLFAGRPGHTYDDAFWASVRTLYDEAFPGLTLGIDRAAALGVQWAPSTTPFAFFEGERCVAHVGVLVHPMRFEGRVVDVAGIHAVCTATDRQQRGLCRELLSRAVSWAEPAHDVMKLHTDSPEVYASHGFVVTPTFRSCSTATPATDVRKRLLAPSTDPSDAALLARLLRGRTPVSHLCASADDGWLITMDAALSRRLDRAMWWLEDHDAIVVFDDEDGTTLVVEVLAATLPAPEIIAGAAPDPRRPILYTFTPDRLEPSAIRIPAPPEIGAFMVRGTWPIELAHGLSPLWEH